MTATTEQYTPVLNDAGNIEHDGMEFPATCTSRVSYTSGLHSYGPPPVDGRWVIYTGWEEPVNLYWKGDCKACGHTIWFTDHPDFDPDDYLDNDHLPAPNGVLDPEADDEVEYSMCLYCHYNGSTARTLRQGREARENGDLHTWVKWPEDFMAQRLRDMEEEIGDEWAVIHPVEPVHGAFVFVKGDATPYRFDRWDNGRIHLIDGDSHGLAPDMVEVATPVILGVKHPKVVTIFPNGRPGLRGRVLRQRNNQIVASLEDVGRVTYSADHFAVLAPPLNPETEKPEDTVVRLRREGERLRVMMHRRMVAEGEQRRWCEAFDPILIGTGLEPRKAKRVFEGTMKFRYETDSDISVESVRKSWSDYIPSSAVSVTEVTESVPVANRVLS